MMDRKLESLIKEFLHLLQNTADDPKEIHKILDFLTTLLHFKEPTPPTVEMITILKYQKPKLFYHVKNSISSTSPKYLILQLGMNYELALQRLKLENQLVKH